MIYKTARQVFDYLMYLHGFYIHDYSKFRSLKMAAEYNAHDGSVQVEGNKEANIAWMSKHLKAKYSTAQMVHHPMWIIPAVFVGWSLISQENSPQNKFLLFCMHMITGDISMLCLKAVREEIELFEVSINVKNRNKISLTKDE
mmetsp:Transcript_27067/g.65696  ORF Transcript_27067/g.65696 Transcript_27067/m.65696 type:complete len:143 (-) Transcript_27067:19-447(-)